MILCYENTKKNLNKYLKKIIILHAKTTCNRKTVLTEEINIRVCYFEYKVIITSHNMLNKI